MAKKKKQNLSFFSIISIIIVVLVAFIISRYTYNKSHSTSTSQTTFSSTSAIPQDVINSLSAPKENEASDNNKYKVLNNNNPYFSKEDLSTSSFENYSNLDKLGRVGQANAIIGVDLMPTEKREEISKVRPSGWQSNRGSHVYDRSHLIAFQLAGENANEKNLMTGTRFMNLNMIPFENQVADYVKNTKKHVRYRVTPVYKDNDLVAQGVIMEAMSVEDSGASIKYNVFIYNYQKGVTIDYKTGKYTVK
ncbi:DNA/RNA non-specific endonuclease [Gemella cuniculi]|uniref:DNA/RNA non-specific endonuclease n=1 Tax=Gemella cuniculi TaxID=150240 RepID=UPI0003FEDD1C|nr:DNA/RNA non-specific endonuclease [Gemella cuniculi]